MKIRELVSIQKRVEDLALRIEVLLATERLPGATSEELKLARNHLKQASLALATVAL